MAIRHSRSRRLWLVSAAASVLVVGCAPVGRSPLRPLHTAVRPLGHPHGRRPAGTVMVATLAPRAVVLTPGMVGLAVGAPRDDNGRGLVRAVARLRVARKVVRSPLSRASRRELLRSAREARASLLVTSQVVDLRLTRGPNASFAGLVVCALTLGMTLVGIPACMAIPAHTLEAEVEVELTLWDVGQGRRVWQRRVRRKGWLSMSSYTARRAISRAITRGTNAAYRAALPGLARALAARVVAHAQNSGVKR